MARKKWRGAWKSSEMGGEDRREGKSVSGERGREVRRREREKGGRIPSSRLSSRRKISVAREEKRARESEEGEKETERGEK